MLRWGMVMCDVRSCLDSSCLRVPCHRSARSHGMEIRWRAMSNSPGLAVAVVGAICAGRGFRRPTIRSGPLAVRYVSPLALAHDENRTTIRQCAAHSEENDKRALMQELRKLQVKELKRELETLGINPAGLFEKKDLVERLVQARLDSPVPPPQGVQPDVDKPSPVAETETPKAADPSLAREIRSRCRAMRVKELRTELGSRGIRWADALDKDELAERLERVLIAEAAFCRSGRFRPGAVTQISGSELEEELGDPSTPLLIDFFATWCGPCKTMEPEFEAAARRVGSRLRVGRLDSDKESAAAARFNIKAMPTIILFDRTGRLVKRLEGSLREQQIIDFINSAGF
eukprot:TRINITY_DN12648_c0_g2_i1.p1 TRINITY_DN12648_c0_g2~~TRINITY_DN12648_c0_g2_i1.p1  ORF type:complete len:345 (-),score=45.02 TRINITY_DN12648_c0_g2_i1:455-1489(-)